ncbi:methyl-accepting chemotaxis protein [Bradyrhizobium sp. USDA 4369]
MVMIVARGKRELRVSRNSAQVPNNQSTGVSGMKIKTRLYVGFGVLVALGLLMAGFGLWQSSATSERVERLSTQAEYAIGVVKISSELQAIRRALLRYQFDNDEASFAEAERRLGATATMLEQTATEAGSDMQRDSARQLQKSIVAIQEARMALGGSVKVYSTGRTALFAEGDKMTADVQKFLDAMQSSDFADAARTLESRVLLVRVANWRFLATRDPKGRDIFKSNLGKATAQVAELEKRELTPAQAKLLDEVKQGLGRYAEAFDKTSASMLRGDEVYYKDVAPLTAAAIEIIDRAEKDIRASFAATLKETHERISSATAMQQTLAVLAGLLGIAIAILIARSISTPLTSLVRDADRLSGGDTSVEFLDARRGDEIGDVAKSVARFRDNVIAQQKTAKEVAEAAELREATSRNMEAAVAQFRAASEQLLGTVGDNAGKMTHTAKTLTGVAGQATEQASAAAAASEQTASNVQTVASAAEELASSIHEIGRQIERANTNGACGRLGDGALGERDRGAGAGRAEHLLGGRPDPGDRRADQPARAQCDHRGGPCRRCRPRLRRGRAGGEVAGRADRAGDAGDRAAHSGHPDVDGQCGGVRQGGWPGDARDRRGDLGDCDRGRATGRCHARDLAERPDGSRRHPEAREQHHNRRRCDPRDQSLRRSRAGRLRQRIERRRCARRGGAGLLRPPARRKWRPHPQRGVIETDASGRSLLRQPDRP